LITALVELTDVQEVAVLVTVNEYVVFEDSPLNVVAEVFPV
jgi:hypothetical protein